MALSPRAVEMIWLTVGFSGQGLFTARFLVQWAVSEKRRDSVVPVAFWWLSLAGGLVLLSYAIHRRDPVIILGQSMGLIVYVRNLMLVSEARQRVLEVASDPSDATTTTTVATASLARPRGLGAARQDRVEPRSGRPG